MSNVSIDLGREAARRVSGSARDAVGTARYSCDQPPGLAENKRDANVGVVSHCHTERQGERETHQNITVDSCQQLNDCIKEPDNLTCRILPSVITAKRLLNVFIEKK